MSDIVNTTEYAELTNAVQAIKRSNSEKSTACVSCDKPRAVSTLLWNRTICFFVVETNKLVNIENNSLVEPFEQVSQIQAQLLGATFEMLSGGPAQTHVGTGGGGSSSDMPWGEKKRDSNMGSSKRKR